MTDATRTIIRAALAADNAVSDDERAQIEGALRGRVSALPDPDVRTYAAPPPPEEKKKAKTKEEKQAEKEAKKRIGLLQSAKDEAESKFNDWIEEHADDDELPKWFVDCAVNEMISQILDYGSGDLELVVDAFARNTGFTASNAEADAVYKEYLAKEGGEA